MIYDTTLRDGTQGESVSASCDDKLCIARRLSQFGVDWIEAGWPGSNPKDAEFFKRAATELDEATRSKLVAFGSTRRKGAVDPGADAQLQALVASGCRTVCIVCKSSAWQTEAILGASLDENVRMIEESVRWLLENGVSAVHVDLEHFFDGFVEARSGRDVDRDYALRCCGAAVAAGASALVLCDTNGGSTPWDIEAATAEVVHLFGDTVRVGVHAHDDSGLAVANSLAALRAGARVVQGTINGVGERCGNANLCAIVANIALKSDGVFAPYRERAATAALPPRCAENLSELRALSRFVDETFNLQPRDSAAYVGNSAFAHKGGLHVSAVAKHSEAYEHVPPSAVGNQQRVLVSELSGRANIMSAIAKAGFAGEGEQSSALQQRSAAILARVKQLESMGYSFEGADASVHLMLLYASPGYCSPFSVADYSVTCSDEDLDSPSRALSKQQTLEQNRPTTARATVKVKLASDDSTLLEVAEGTGPIDALAAALVKALAPTYASVRNVRVTDYKVRILDPSQASRAATRVAISFRDDETGTAWTTVAVDRNVISASANALVDGLEFAIIEHADFCMVCELDDEQPTLLAREPAAEAAVAR